MHGFPFPRRAGSESVELLPDAVLARLPLLPDVPEQAHVMAEKLASPASPGGAAAGRQSETLPAIELTGVVKEFHSGGEVITAVRGLDLAIRQGEFFSMLGPSGCGKTTTMR